MAEGTWIHSIYTKLALALLCAVVPLYVISLQINQSDAERVREGIEHSVASQARYYLSSLEQAMDQVARYQQELASNRQLDMLSNASQIMSPEEKRNAILAVRQQLLQLKFSGLYLENTKAYIPSLGAMIAANQSYFEIPQEEYAAIRAISNPFKYPFVYHDGKLYIGYVHPLLPADVEPPFLLSAELDIPKMEEVLDQFKYNGLGGAALISDSREWILASERDDALVKQIVSGLASDQSGETGMTSINHEGASYLVHYEPSHKMGAVFVIYMPEDEVFGPLQRNRERIWQVSLFSLAVIAIAAAVVYRLIQQPLRKLMIAFRSVGNGDFGTKIERDSRDEFAYLYRHFNQTTQKLQELVYEVFEQKYRTQHAELKQLQSQINPHFLYNSFFTIYRMAKLDEGENIERFTKHLAEYYRFLTRDSQDVITLAEEVAHARAYVEIQQFRFGERVEVGFAPLPEDIQDWPVPRLIVQPIIENAYTYALETQSEGAQLSISFALEADAVFIIVQDNGGMIDDAQIALMEEKLRAPVSGSQTTGLTNIHRRLQLHYGEAAGVQLHHHAGGLIVTLRLLRQEVRNHEEV